MDRAWVARRAGKAAQAVRRKVIKTQQIVFNRIWGNAQKVIQAIVPKAKDNA
jgi:hypothetical protein